MTRAAAALAALAAATACSPGYRDAAPAATTTTTPTVTPTPHDPFAEEWALRVSYPPDPDRIDGTLARGQVRAGEPFRVTGTSDCGILHAFVDLAGAEDVTLAVRVRGTFEFTAEGTIPRGTPPQEATVTVSTLCGRPESAGVLTLPLRVTA